MQNVMFKKKIPIAFENFKMLFVISPRSTTFESLPEQEETLASMSGMFMVTIFNNYCKVS